MNGPGSKEPRTTRKNVPGRQNGPAGSSVSTAAAYANAYQNNTNNEPPKVGILLFINGLYIFSMI